MVAHEVGLSHLEDAMASRARRIVSEDSPRRCAVEPFLLIVRTRHIVTVPPAASGTSSAGFSEFPAYSRVLQLPRLIVTAAVYRGLASVLRVAPNTST